MAGFAAMTNPDNIHGGQSSDDLSNLSLPRPNPAIFNSAGKLLKKHDSINERLSLPSIPYTPGTPKSVRSKFVLPSMLSPFALSPNAQKNSRFDVPGKTFSSSLHASMTPLRQGLSLDQLLFDNDGDERSGHSPSRMILDTSSSSSPRNLKESDMFGGSSGFCSDIDFEESDSANMFYEGTCDLSIEMLRPSIWRNPAVHIIQFDDQFDQSDDDFVLPQDKSLYEDYFLKQFDSSEVFGDGAFSTVFRVHSRIDGNLYAVKKSKVPFSGASDRTRRLKEVKHLFLTRNSPHCIKIVSAWEQSGYLYIQTEMCDNGRYILL